MIKYCLHYIKNAILYSPFFTISLFISLTLTIIMFSNNWNEKKTLDVITFYKDKAIVDLDGDVLSFNKYKILDDGKIEIIIIQDTLFILLFVLVIMVFINIITYDLDLDSIKHKSLESIIKLHTDGNLRYLTLNNKILCKQKKEDDGYFPYISTTDMYNYLYMYINNNKVLENFIGTKTEKRNKFIDYICQKDQK